MAANTQAYIDGSNLMLFVKDGTGYTSIGAATTHTLSITTETADISNKDLGRWGGSIGRRINYSLSTSNMFAFDADGKGIQDLYNYMVNFTELEVVFGLNEGFTDPYAVVPTGGWNPATGQPQWKGKIIISSLNVSANSGEQATFDCEMQGIGALELVTA
ncbi:phage tail protein [Parabacteroides sp. OttesenSCG-928-J18]|nr:phage tail protein [Parabacteroides sp. OttesenSCG-928-J18]